MIFAIALRNLSRQKQRSALVIGAIAFCFGISLAIGALANGSSAGALEIWGGWAGGHIYIRLDHLEDGKSVSVIENDAPIRSALDKLGLSDRRIVNRSNLGVSLVFAGKTGPGDVRGIDQVEKPDLLKSLTMHQGTIDELFASPHGLILSNILADRIGASFGDEIQLAGATARGQRNVMDATIVGIYTSTSPYDADDVYLNRAFVNEFLAIPPTASTSLNIWLTDVGSAPAIADSIRAALATTYVANTENTVNIFNNTIMRDELVADETAKQQFQGERLRVRTIQDAAAVIASAAGFMRAGGIFILVLILIVTVIGIYNNFRMIILERTKEIGTMRALGIQRNGIRQIFLTEGLILLLISFATGILFGLLLMLVVGSLVVPVPAYTDIIFHNSHIHFKIDLVYFGLTSAAIATTVLLSMLMPASIAARISPAEALRETH